MNVYIGGTLIGSIRDHRNFNVFKFSYGIYDENNDKLVSLKRCRCILSGCCSKYFDIILPNGQNTNKAISVLGVADFQVEFPDEMNTIKQKILLIASAIFIQYKREPESDPATLADCIKDIAEKQFKKILKDLCPPLHLILCDCF